MKILILIVCTLLSLTPGAFAAPFPPSPDAVELSSFQTIEDVRAYDFTRLSKREIEALLQQSWDGVRAALAKQFPEKSPENIQAHHFEANGQPVGHYCLGNAILTEVLYALALTAEFTDTHSFEIADRRVRTLYQRMTIDDPPLFDFGPTIEDEEIPLIAKQLAIRDQYFLNEFMRAYPILTKELNFSPSESEAIQHLFQPRRCDVLLHHGHIASHILAQYGWQGVIAQGKDVFRNIWLVFVHLDMNVTQQKQALSLMAPLVERGLIDKGRYKFLAADVNINAGGALPYLRRNPEAIKVMLKSLKETGSPCKNELGKTFDGEFRIMPKDCLK